MHAHATCSYGKVYKALCLETQEPVAIKRIADVFANVTNAKRFLREIRILRSTYFVPVNSCPYRSARTN